MKESVTTARKAGKGGIAALALIFVLATPAAALANPCQGCAYDDSSMTCGVALAFIIDGCCGNWVDGGASCVPGWGYAVACETGQQCMCNSQGQECDIVRAAS